MILAVRFPALGLLAAMLSAEWPGPPADGDDIGRYDYHMEATPEEGPIDDTIMGRYTAQWQECQNKAIATADNEACFLAELARQDAILNNTWKAVLARLAADQHKLARQSNFCTLERDMFKWSLHRPSPPPGHPCDYNSVGGWVGERAGAG